MNKVRIEKVRVKDLHRYASEFLAKCTTEEVVPISLQRALAQSKNPCASDEDIGLLVAYLDGKSIGFQGILPGLLRIKNGVKKIYWISSLYISPEHRHSGVFTEIFKIQLSLNCDFFYTGLSAEIVSVLRGLRVRELPVIGFNHLNLDRVSNFLNLPKRGFRKLFGASNKPLDSARPETNRFRAQIYNFLLKQYEYANEEFSYEEVQEVSADWIDFKESTPRFERDAATINWMLKTPWLSKEDGKYYFGQTPGDWGKHVAIQIRSKTDGSHCGFVVLYLASRGGNALVRILDCHFKDEKHKRAALLLALKYGQKINATAIDFCKTLMCSEELGFLAKLLVQEVHATCFYILKSDSSLTSCVDEIRCDLGDGDTAFV